MVNNEHEDTALYQYEGPKYHDGVWMANIKLLEQTSDTFQGETIEEVQEQILHFLGQKSLEIEKARVALRKRFVRQSVEGMPINELSDKVKKLLNDKEEN
ncbi:MAG: hypothetical protein ACR2H5_06860 [Ktedonobacteraceae bacterium]